MQEAIALIKKFLLREDLPEKDDAGVIIPINVDENIRNNAFKECITLLENNL